MVYDLGEEYIDSNQNNQWDENESFDTSANYYFPIIKKCLKIDYEASFLTRFC